MKIDNDRQFADLSNLTIISVIGDDAEKLLQGQTSCDFASVSEDYSPLGAFCNHQGRIRGIFRAIKLNDGFLLLTTKSIVESFVAELKKYAVFFKVSINIEEDYNVYGLLCEEPLNEATNFTERDETNIWIANQTQKPSCYLVTKDLMAVNSEQTNLWHSNEIRSGLSWIEEETFEKLLPHYLKLPELGGISFTKGCYTGQEVIARMHYKGKLKHQLKCFSVNTDEKIALGTLIYQEDKKLGQVIRATKDDKNNWILLSELNQSDDTKKFHADLKNAPILTEEQLTIDESHLAS